MQKRPQPRAQRGLSLVEVMTAITIAAILGTGAAPSLRRLFEARRLDGLATQLAGDIHATRAEAIARNQTLRLSLHADASGGCWVMHSGNADQCSCGATGAAVCTAGAESIKTVRWSAAEGVLVSGNVAAIGFDAMHGTATPAGTWRVTASDGRAVHHVVNVMGRLRSCSPQGAVPGFRAC